MQYYLKRNWKYSTLVCILQIAVWGMQAGVQLLLMQCFNAAINFDFSAFLRWSGIDLAAWAFYFLLCFLLDYAQTYTVRMLNNQVRHDLYLSLLNKNYREYHDLNSGEYISWLTNNIKQIEKLAWNPFFDCVGRGAQVLWSMFVLFTLHWSLLVTALVSAAIMLTLPKLFQNKVESMGRDCANAEAKAVSRLKDLLSGFDVLLFFGKRKHFLQQGDSVSDQIEKPAFHLGYTKSAIECFSGFMSVSLQVLSEIVIVILALQGLIMISVLAGGSNLIAGVTNGLQNISNLRLNLAQSKPYFEKIHHNDNDNQKATSHKTLEPLHEAIQLENISFQYDKAPILKDINLSFRIGKKYALIGPSGCGKSTLLKILLGWLPEYTGKVLLDGKDARNYPIDELQKHISYIEQNVFLFNTTIRENITLGGDFTQAQLEQALKDSALMNDLAAMPDGLETIVGEEGRNLSGGQKQRVAIARALIHNRSILLVDEGTSSLDQQNADIVEHSLLANPNLTLILISHHLAEERKQQFDAVYSLTKVDEAAL